MISAPLDSPSASQQSDNEENEKDEEQDLRDSGGSSRYSSKTEHSGYQSDNQKNPSIMQHRLTLRDLHMHFGCREGAAGPRNPSNMARHVLG
jgi:hypothetical protein